MENGFFPTVALDRGRELGLQRVGAVHAPAFGVA
jgi:hypothetical protein